MPYLAVLLILFQVVFGMHAIRTGRDMFWLWIILLLPGLGCLLYFLTQFMPDFLQSVRVRRAGKSLIKTLDPQRSIRELQDELQVSDCIENRLALADAYIQAGQAVEAVPLYEKCLSGIHEDDPGILLNLAQALFLVGEYSRTKEVLDQLIQKNPDYKSHDGHLLYAKTLETLNMSEQAISEYEILAHSYPGEEARVRFGLLLKRQGQEERARELFRETLVRIKRAPKFYLKKEKHWIEIASENLK